MNKKIKFSGLQIILLFLIFNLSAAGNKQYESVGWKAGVARVSITPKESVWLAGYAFRDHSSEGTLVDLWAKALALEDAGGKKVILITADLLTFPKSISDTIRNQIGAKYGLERDQIILNSSHTHTGPVLTDALSDIYSYDEIQAETIRRFSDHVKERIVNLAGEALQSMVQANLYSGNGITRFQVNRRNNTEKTINSQTDLKGPSDYSVPVLKVTDSEGRLVAVAFGYACHPTVLGIYQFSGDYPGFAQIELEKMYPGATAMFFQGAGGDQNPLPRGSIPLAKQYGLELAAAVDRVIKEDTIKLEPKISTAYSEIELKFSTLPTAEELMKIENESTGYQKRWATHMLEIINTEGSLPGTYVAYPVQIWKLGSQPIMILGGEILVEYSIELKKLFGSEIFVMGYSNDVMAYIPSETVLREGGYEGESSKMVYGMPARWAEGIEARILDEFRRLAEMTEVPVVKSENETVDYNIKTK